MATNDFETIGERLAPHERVVWHGAHTDDLLMVAGAVHGILAVRPGTAISYLYASRGTRTTVNHFGASAPHFTSAGLRSVEGLAVGQHLMAEQTVGLREQDGGLDDRMSRLRLRRRLVQRAQQTGATAVGSIRGASDNHSDHRAIGDVTTEVASEVAALRDAPVTVVQLESGPNAPGDLVVAQATAETAAFAYWAAAGNGSQHRVALRQALPFMPDGWVGLPRPGEDEEQSMFVGDPATRADFDQYPIAVDGYYSVEVVQPRRTGVIDLGGIAVRQGATSIAAVG